MNSSTDDFRMRVLEATDLVELVGRSVKLIRRGRNFVGLCPFHQEKTPSFNVNPERQFFNCFGCKASGTAFDFVMKRDRVEFKDAMITLARTANLELPKWAGGGDGESASVRQTLLEIHSLATAYFESNLAHPQIGAAARNYLTERGFNEAAIKQFHLGVATDSWESLLRSPQLRKFQPQQLALAGMVKARDSGGFYDTFRNRLMFPIRDETGRVIGFGGRVMPQSVGGSQDPAKYLNSPETPLFSKSRVAFGLDSARAKIVESRTVAIVEGYTDVIMAHQFGASNVVSVLGTAMTPQHVALLRRFADRIVLLFDADVAGEAAVDRAVELFLTQPIEVAIASMPEGLDPDEFVLAHGAEGFAKLIADAPDALTFKWKQLRRHFDAKGDSLTGQQKAVQAYLDLLAGARGTGPVDSIRWGGALSRVSRLTGISTEDLNNRFRMGGSSTGRATGRSGSRSTYRNTGQSEGFSQPTTARRPPVNSSQYRAQRWILGTLLAEPGRWHDVQMKVNVEDFDPGDIRELADFYWHYQRNEGEPQFNELLAALPDDEIKSLAIELLDEVEPHKHRDQGLADSIGALQQQRQTLERAQLEASLRKGSGSGRSNRGGDDSSSDATEIANDDEIDQLIRLTQLSRGNSDRNRNI